MLGLIFAFPRQQWLRERAPLLRYTYVTCLCSYMYFNWCLLMEFKPKHVVRTRSAVKYCLNFCHDYGPLPVSTLRQHRLSSSVPSFEKMSPFTQRTNGRVYKNPRLILLWIPLLLMQEWLLSRICWIKLSRYAAKLGPDVETAIKEYVSKTHKERNRRRKVTRQ